MGLYGSVNNYDGKPTQMQVDRAGAIERELGDVSSAFDAWVKAELGGAEQVGGGEETAGDHGAEGLGAGMAGIIAR